MSEIPFEQELVGRAKVCATDLSPDGIRALAKEIERLQAENETLRAEKRWILVEERLPEIGKEVLVYFASSDRVEVASRRGSDGEFYSPSQKGYSWSNITHWQPRPSVEVLK